MNTADGLARLWAPVRGHPPDTDAFDSADTLHQRAPPAGARYSYSRMFPAVSFTFSV
jgi:hypothetical protein